MTRNQVLANLKGVFAPVATPFNRRGDLDEVHFKENLRKYAGIGLGGILVTGSTGEALYLNERERLRLVELAREIVRSPQVLMAGTGLEGTRETIRLSREAVERGADALLVLPPSYYKPLMNGKVLVAHFSALADAVKRPVLIYSIPQFSGIHIDATVISELSRHPNIAGLKESSGNFEFVEAVLKTVRPGFRVLVGSAGILLRGLEAGAAGAVLGQADFLPGLCLAAYQAFQRGDAARAQDLQQRLIGLAQDVAPYGVPGVKGSMDLSGYFGGDPRPPLLPVDTKTRRAIRAALKAARQGLQIDAA